MKLNEFFEKISKGSNATEKLFNILTARGFLLNYDEENIYISDNSHTEDWFYLKNLLKDYSIGDVVENCIVIQSSEHINLLWNLFKESTAIQFACTYRQMGWDYFSRRIHGYKIPVEDLEPSIALYIKALSACGIITEASCDGNHTSNRVLWIIFQYNGNAAWHYYIWKNLIGCDKGLNWNEDYTSIEITDRNKYDTYLTLINTALWLYRNRLLLRHWKQEAFRGIGKCIRRRNIDDEIIPLFYSNLNLIISKKDGGNNVL